MFCPRCSAITDEKRCPSCGNKALREAESFDYCYLTEKDPMWAGMLSDLLRQSGIQFITKDEFGAAMAAKFGRQMERTRFYVPFEHFEEAKALVAEFFRPEQKQPVDHHHFRK